MIGAMVCPQCGGVGQNQEDNENCVHCKGWGVMHMIDQPCPVCTGVKMAPFMKCTKCGGSKRYVRVAAISGAVVGDKREMIEVKLTDTIPADELREAFTILRVGYEGSEPEYGKTLGRLAMLLDLSAEFDGHPIISWLKEDAIIFEPSGIWVQRGEHACRIWEYDVEHI